MLRDNRSPSQRDSLRHCRNGLLRRGKCLPHVDHCDTLIMEFPNLHDAVLGDVHVDWEAGTATVQFRPVPGEPLVLHAYGVLEVRLDKREPWGPSVFVNSVTSNEVSPGGEQLVIQMQSGDPLVITARRFELAPAATS